MVGQGFDVADFVWSEQDYKLYNKLAGNTVTTSVLGAVIMGLTFAVLVKNPDGSLLGAYHKKSILLHCDMLFLTHLKSFESPASDRTCCRAVEVSRSVLGGGDPPSDDSDDDQYEESSDDDNGNYGQDWLDCVEAFTFDQIQYEA